MLLRIVLVCSRSSNSIPKYLAGLTLADLFRFSVCRLMLFMLP